MMITAMTPYRMSLNPLLIFSIMLLRRTILVVITCLTILIHKSTQARVNVITGQLAKSLLKDPYAVAYHRVFAWKPNIALHSLLQITSSEKRTTSTAYVVSPRPWLSPSWVFSGTRNHMLSSTSRMTFTSASTSLPKAFIATILSREGVASNDVRYIISQTIALDGFRA